MASTLVASAESFLLYAPAIARNVLSVPSMTATTSTPPPSQETAPSTRIPGGELLSLGVDGVAEVLGGLGRAKMVWGAIADGVDPFSSEGLAGFLTDKTSGILHDSVEGLPWQVRAAFRCPVARGSSFLVKWRYPYTTAVYSYCCTTAAVLLLL